MDQEPEESVKDFLETAASILGWGDLRNEVVMDIGCGLGYYSTMYLNRLFPKLKQIIAIDQGMEIIRNAISGNEHQKISYYVADIADANTLRLWVRRIPKIVCVDCLVWLRDQKIGFVNMYHLLRPGGTAAIMTGTNSHFPEALKHLLTTTEWRNNPLATESQFPRFPKKSLDLQDYHTMMKEIGFEVIHLEEFYRTYRITKGYYENREADFLTPLMYFIPESQKENFYKDFRASFKVVHGITSEEDYRVRVKTAVLFIRRPLFPFSILQSTASTSKQLFEDRNRS